MAPFDEGELYRWVEHQAAMGERRPGSPAGKLNEDFLEGRLRAFGLANVRREAVPVSHWTCDEASLRISGRAFPVFGIPHTCFTPRDGLEAELVHAAPGLFRAPAAWRGKIVVAEIGFPPLDPAALVRLAMGVHDPDKDLLEGPRPATWIRLGWHFYRWAALAGAAGFVGILKDQPGGTCRMYAPYGFKEKDILDKPVPGVWARRDDGEALLRLAKDGAAGRLTLTGKAEAAKTHNVVGEIPGTSNETIVLSTHHDSPFTSPVEDGTGVAVVLALARHLAGLGNRRRRIVVLFSAGHFYGSIGTRSFIAKHADVVSRTVIEISIEHIALEARENAAGKLECTGKPEPAGIFIPFSRKVRDLVARGLVEHGMGRALLLPSEGPLGGYPPTDGGDWYEAGVPVINFISNPVYLLTDDDALQWVDKPRLAVAARFFAALIAQLDEVPSRTISQLDFPVRRLAMKVLKRITRAKSTAFGTRPLH